MNRVELHLKVEAEGPLNLHCWGDFALTGPRGEELTPRSRKARALLAWLAFHPDRPVSRERLCGLLWGDRGEEQARASLRQVLFELRPFSEGAEPLLAMTRNSVTLHGERLRSDLSGEGLRQRPGEDEPLFANLDDVDEAFDNWLRATRASEWQRLERSDPGAGPRLASAMPPAPLVAPRRAWVFAAAAVLLLPLVALLFWGGGLQREMPDADGAALAVLPFDGDRRGGDVEALLRSAHELARSEESAKIEAAEDLLRQAVALDPNDARAHAALARTIFWLLPFRPTHPEEWKRWGEATAHARTAVRLAPDLAQAHLAMADAQRSILNPTANLAELETARRLDPGLADSWMQIAFANERLGRYPRMMEALRRAVRLEPYWWLSSYFSAEIAWDLGLRAESMQIASAVIRKGDPFLTAMAKSDIDWRRGDFSGAVANADEALNHASEGQQVFARTARGRALHAAGLTELARSQGNLYPVTQEVFDAWNGRPLSPEALARWTMDPDLFWERNPVRELHFRNLVNAGRTAELVDLLDRSGGSPTALRSRHFGPVHLALAAPPLVLALRAEGRPAQAEALLAAARAGLQPVLSASLVPDSVLALDAQLLMLEGKREAALGRLEQAAARGWWYAKQDQLADIGDEPAFRRLRGDPRFERLRAAQAAHGARERSEILALTARSGTN